MFTFRLSNPKLFKLCLFSGKHMVNKTNSLSYTQLINNRTYHLTSNNHGRNPENLKTPDLVYFPQVIRWLKTKIGFKVLQKTWDPEFSEGAFIFGTTQAICRVTEVISIEDKHDELRELVTPNLQKKLKKDMQTKLTDLQKKIIVLTPRDIKLLIPTEVCLNQAKDRKQCLIGLRSLAVKWQDLNGGVRLAIIALQTEFIRDYTTEISRDNGWTLRVFDVLECGVIGETRRAQPP